MGIIVVSLPFTAYLWAALIAFCWFPAKTLRDLGAKMTAGENETIWILSLG